MNSLTKIVSEMKENAPFAELELENVNPKVRAGMQARKNAAKVRMDELKKEFSEEVWNNAIFIVPVKARSSEALKEFVSAADAVGGCMPVNYQYWDEKVGTGWWGANGSKPQNIDTVHTIQLFDEIRKTATELKLDDVATPHVPRQIFFNSVDDCVTTVKDVVTKSCGADFRLALLKKATADVAETLWDGKDGQVVPFVLTNATQEDVDALSTVAKKFYAVNLSAVTEVTEEFVQKTLEKIAKAHKKSK